MLIAANPFIRSRMKRGWMQKGSEKSFGKGLSVQTRTSLKTFTNRAVGFGLLQELQLWIRAGKKKPQILALHGGSRAVVPAAVPERCAL
ncbi:MAG TPA: hypothetical protein VNT99_10730 [Methylomirabilota bacterium]|nr:hypothetical protein [Methylomirabilota bacterium]